MAVAHAAGSYSGADLTAISNLEIQYSPYCEMLICNTENATMEAPRSNCSAMLYTTPAMLSFIERLS